MGIKIIDSAIGGICNGDFLLIVGRLGTGKSTLATWIVQNWWLRGRRILVVSKEMLASDIFSRIDAMIGFFNPLDIRREEEGIREKLGVIRHLVGSAGAGEIYVPSSAVGTVDQVYEVAKVLDIDAVIVDGVHLMQATSTTAARWERTADVSNALKQLGISLQRPVIGVSQIKRVGGKREYDPEDIAYSDALGQDADFVMATYPLEKDKGRYEVQLIKNRFGPEIATIIRVDFDTMQVIEESIGEE
jgi:replicative DNA helicase